MGKKGYSQDTIMKNFPHFLTHKCQYIVSWLVVVGGQGLGTTARWNKHQLANAEMSVHACILLTSGRKEKQK